ncbi:MAG: response regulator transcription factor [Bryobacterales bacterium]|nr:response regulator transcription factor [Bryobacterales bacterium]
MTIEGIRRLLRDHTDLELTGEAPTLPEALDLVRDAHPAVVIVDKAFGLPPVMDWLHMVRGQYPETMAIVWGVSMNEGEALRFVQAGASGVMRKSVPPEEFVQCLRQVADGGTWMEEGLFQATERPVRHSRSNLTPREREVVELVEQGLKNKDIARIMGIRPGTVKIHLKHIFEKTGVRGRFGLALSGLKEKGILQYPTV